ncbi:hypothetical protein CPT_Sansa108 [Caulobacter phage Sansa]|uniref:Uncharacterized protein n=1 Tax=Caulobacter phage Sansa TaxID=1675600 RepID=A0A0K1LLX3_9CAUD|nr:hypothetical protein HOR07_gp108 [Caulobacter phage Sansa]AKU43512.1 hypothetical protein CPT_Sansa108 [Caulobacter phage Sansa]
MTKPCFLIMTGARPVVPVLESVHLTRKEGEAARDEARKTKPNPEGKYRILVDDLDTVSVPREVFERYLGDPREEVLTLAMDHAIPSDPAPNGYARLEPRDKGLADLSLTRLASDASERFEYGPAAKVYLNDYGKRVRSGDRVELAIYLRDAADSWVREQIGPPKELRASVPEQLADDRVEVAVTFTLQTSRWQLMKAGWRASPELGDDEWSELRSTRDGGPEAADMAEIIAAAVCDYMEEGDYHLGDINVAVAPLS